MRQVGPDRYELYFTAAEIESFAHRKNKASLAARYLVKEIIREKIGEELQATDVEILNDEHGRPRLSSGKISPEQMNQIHFSISHTKDIAIAMLVFDEDGAV